MKKIIRFLARVSGVSKDIRNETIQEVGGQLYQSSHWFNHPDLVKVGNTLAMLGLSLKNYGSATVSKIRDLVNDLGEESIHGDGEGADRARNNF